MKSVWIVTSEYDNYLPAEPKATFSNPIAAVNHAKGLVVEASGQDCEIRVFESDIDLLSATREVEEWEWSTALNPDGSTT